MRTPSPSSRAVPRGRSRPVAVLFAALVLLAAGSTPAIAAPSSTAPPASSSAPAPTGDGSGARDDHATVLTVPSTVVPGTTIQVGGTNWGCSSVTVTPGWVATPRTVRTTNSTFETTVPVPADTAPGRTILTATCTSDPTTTRTQPLMIVTTRRATTNPVVVTSTDRHTTPVPPPPSTEARSPGTPSATPPIGLIAVAVVLVLTALAGTVTVLARRPATAPASPRPRGPVGATAPTASRRRGSATGHPTEPTPDVRILVHRDLRPRLDIRTFPPRVRTVQIRAHRGDPVITAREVRR